MNSDLTNFNLEDFPETQEPSSIPVRLAVANQHPVIGNASIPSQIPSSLLRRALHEIESGDLDQRLVLEHLGHLQRDSDEFARQYVYHKAQMLLNLKLQPRVYRHEDISRQEFSAILPRPSAQPNVPTAISCVFATRRYARSRTAEIPNPHIDAINPWNINNLKDLWDFFGILLSLVAGIQSYAAYLAAKFIAPLLQGPWRSIPLVCAATTLIFFLIDGAILHSYRKQHFHQFIPPLSCLGALSALLAIGLRLQSLFVL